MTPPDRFGMPFRPTLLALLCSLSVSANAATPETDPQNDGKAVVLDNVNINAQAPSSSDLPPPYAGGQVARGGQLGVLGNQDIMDVPFSMASYTEQLIQDQQAENVADVLLNDSSVRQASGFSNQAQVFMIRGLPLNGDDISYNGLYGVLPRQIISTDALERVEVFKGPNHPYTEALLSAIPDVDGGVKERIRLGGEIPSPANPPSGCVFHPRCPRVIEGTCAEVEPPVVEVSPNVACTWMARRWISVCPASHYQTCAMRLCR